MEALATALAITCGVALVGMFIGWWAAERRSARAERDTAAAEKRANVAEAAARRILRDAINSPSDDVRRNAREIQQFAGLPRHPARITDVDHFLNDLFNGGR